MLNAATVLILNSEAVNGGTNAPPTIDMMIKEDANFDPSPKPLQDKAKIVGNMMDWKKYTAINATKAANPPPNIAIITEITEPIA